VSHALIVDDDIHSSTALSALVAEERFTVASAHTLRDARRQLALQPPDIVLLDMTLPDGNGLDLFDDSALLAQSQVVLVTAQASHDMSREARSAGAADCLVKPIAAEQLRAMLARVMRPAAWQTDTATLEVEWARSGRFGHLWGRSAPMRRVIHQITRVAGTQVSVLISGESGTGKELVARTLHDLSRRGRQPFLAVNCGAISPNLIESEVFGHEKGSFTGADRLHRGFFEQAQGGTLFLDEITEMPAALQVKLLRVLETGGYMRVGGATPQTADVRVIAATNRDPLRAVAEGQLREDLLYRLNVFPIVMPPLRERLDDVALLAGHFLADIGKSEGQVRRLSPAALARLQTYRWPGNVRELRNAVQRAYVMSDDDVVGAEWLPKQATTPLPASADKAAADVGPTITLPLGATLADAERHLITATLELFDQQRERTAAALGISLKTLYNRLKAYGCESTTVG
jgi:two-component system, NtrC family, response regulator AtoC